MARGVSTVLGVGRVRRACRAGGVPAPAAGARIERVVSHIPRTRRLGCSRLGSDPGLVGSARTGQRPMRSALAPSCLPQPGWRPYCGQTGFGNFGCRNFPCAWSASQVEQPAHGWVTIRSAGARVHRRALARARGRTQVGAWGRLETGRSGCMSRSS